MATPSLSMARRHWVYLDEQRSHELHAEVEARGPETLLVTTEFPAGSRDPAEALQAARRVAAENEVRTALLDIENRLRLTGNYFRADLADANAAVGMKWIALGAATGIRPDLRAIEIPMPGAPTADSKMGFHHFHNPAGLDRLLISMPRIDLDVSKNVLAEMRFRFPRVDEGEMQVLHTRVAPTILKSSLVAEHIEMPKQGYAKLVEPRDYQRTFGDKWVESARTMWRSAASKLLSRKPADTLAPVAPPAPSRLQALEQGILDQRVRRLRAQYMDAGEAERALATGEHAIRRVITLKRRAFSHTAAYELSVLESALLIEYALGAKVHSLVDEEAEKLLRFLQGYY